MASKKVDTNQYVSMLRELTGQGQKVSIPISGNSMYPMLTHGRDSVVLEKAVVYNPRDVVLYMRDDETPVLHRIISRREEGFAMCGDGQEVEEYPKRNQFHLEISYSEYEYK